MNENKILIASNITKTKAQTLFELKSILKNGEQQLVSIFLPLMGLFLLVKTPILDSYLENYTNLNKISLAVPGILSLCIVSTAFTGQAIATGFDRRYAVIKFLATTPLGKKCLIAGKTCAIIIVISIQITIIGITATFLGWTPTFIGLLFSIPSILLGVAAFTALGLLLAGTLKAETNLAIINLLWILFATLGGLIYPQDSLPTTTKNLFAFLPSAALRNAIQDALNLEQINFFACIILVFWATIGIFACKKWFKWNS